jgi:2-oxoacid:acceptor oxidoreductase delta subunit (pyruvate/2-ketoisovalerate family)
MKWLEKYKVNLPNLNKESDYPDWAISLTSTLLNRTGTWRTFRPVYENKTPPCTNACPLHQLIPVWCDALKKNLFREAYLTIIETNPFPSITGRVCYHPCENECNRKDYDEALTIHILERFIGDWGLKNISSKQLRKTDRNLITTKLKIAIIGSGPAGMSAGFYLAREGHKVTIFEKNAKLGGLLRYGIPAYRLPKRILDLELIKLKNLGVKFEPLKILGKNLNLKELQERFDYVIIAYGAHKNRQLGIPNEQASGVLSGLEFLSQVNSGKKTKLGKRVVIIGGGNTAIDSARTVLRLKRKSIILYRRSRAEMPANPHEIADAEKEGVKIEFLVAPVKILVNKRNKVIGLEVVKMKLGEPDPSGRRTPIPIPDSNYVIKCDTIITAIGEQVDLQILPQELKKSSWGIYTDEDGRTNLENIYAIGDCVTGPRTVTEAIQSGRDVAFTILGKKVPKSLNSSVVRIQDLNLNYFTHQNPPAINELCPSARKVSFKEIYPGLSSKLASLEASRCFSCGVCNNCDNCYFFCPDLAVTKQGEKLEFDYDFCKGCGVCAYECPRKAITMIEDTQISQENKE